MIRRTTRRLSCLVLLCLPLAWSALHGQESKTVIGPGNIDLQDGAKLLMAGDAEEGVRRTLLGLDYASTPRERISGLSNLCAGYVLLKQYEEAVSWCDQALAIDDRYWRALANRALAYLQLKRLEEAEADIVLAEEIAPGARSVRLVRSMLLDVTDPVEPRVVIDDRRQEADRDDD